MRMSASLRVEGSAGEPGLDSITSSGDLIEPSASVNSR